MAQFSARRYTVGCMKVTLTIVGTLLLNIILGSICTMQMAMAADMPTHHAAEAVEGVMTPMEPMSRTHCEQCAHHEEKKEPVAQSSSCAGHCLARATSAHPASLVIGSAGLIALAPATFAVPWNTTEDSKPLPAINASPPGTSTHSVVLRL